MDNFIEALYGQPEGTIPEEYDWFAPLLGDWEFDYKNAQEWSVGRADSLSHRQGDRRSEGNYCRKNLTQVQGRQKTLWTAL